jgi:hypothetical protein
MVSHILVVSLICPMLLLNVNKTQEISRSMATAAIMTAVVTACNEEERKNREAAQKKKEKREG